MSRPRDHAPGEGETGRGIEHVHLRDVDPRDHRLLRITPCGAGTIGLAVVTRSENVPVKEEVVSGVVVDAVSLWNALVAVLRSEGVDA